MQALTPLNIESELSYAYLHAVASQAGMSCSPSTRHDDNNGIDATLTAWGPFPGGGYLNEVDIKIQLKATIGTPVDDGENLSYFLKEVKRYDDLRTETVSTARILVVLFLPQQSDDWLGHSEAELALRKCAYWQSLRGAPASTNKTGETIYLPKTQMLTPDGIQTLATRLSHRDFPLYPAP
jgi:hypothetical protein